MKMESKITLTYMIMLVVAFILTGIESVVVFGRNFINLSMSADALYFSFFYIICIWIYTRKHRKLAALGSIVVGAMAVAYGLLLVETGAIHVDTKTGLSTVRLLMSVIYIIYCIVAGFIARKQSKKLLEEDKNTEIVINVNIDNSTQNPCSEQENQE